MYIFTKKIIAMTNESKCLEVILQSCVIMNLPSVTGKVYFFPRCQLIFSFDRRIIYHSKGLWEYIPKSIPSVRISINLSVCLSVPRYSNE